MALKVFVFVLVAVVIVADISAERLVCDRPNEEYQCGSACQTTCKNYGQICPIVNIKCNDACYCIKGYARDDKGTCIPLSKCPK